LDSARSRFAADGFAATSLDTVAADARLTKGAVYHHFANKQALFEAVLDELELETVALITEAAATKASAWEGGIAGVEAFLERCLDPVYRRLCFQEGPVALGYVRWYEEGEKHEIGLIKGMLAALRAEGLLDVDDLDSLTQLLFGCMCGCALSIARAEDPETTSRQMGTVLVRLLTGLLTRAPEAPAEASPARPSGPARRRPRPPAASRPAKLPSSRRTAGSA
jgi:AcrR family transcriptional regulator